MKQIRSQKAMVTGIVDLYLSPLASTRKGHRIRDVLKFNSATRIRTWKCWNQNPVPYHLAIALY